MALDLDQMERAAMRRLRYALTRQVNRHSLALALAADAARDRLACPPLVTFELHMLRAKRRLAAEAML